MIKDQIKNWVKDTLKVENDFSLEHPSDLKHGDFSANVAMVLVKKEGKNPKELAQYFAEKLSENKLAEVSQIESVGGFINISLKKDFFAYSVKEVNEKPEEFGNIQILAGKRFFVEHTQPNPFKEFHIGHLMNNAIGESVARIVKASGAETKIASYHGDKGLHIAKAIWSLIKNNEEPTVETMGRAYAEGNKAYEDDEEVKKEITEINKKVYDQSDDSVNDVYEKGRKASFDYFESLYIRMDSKFDFHFVESEAGEIGKKIVLENVSKVFEDSEGAIIFKGENFEPKTHTRVFLNSEKLPTYEAKEVGLAEIKKQKYNYNESLTVAANEQDAFFNVVEVAIGEIFPELKGKLRHISHGVLKLPSGKMSSRTGTIISAESLIDQVKDKILEKIKDRDFSEEEKNEVSEIVAIGAIKFSILRQAVGGDIIFDFDKSISFEGDSGPYLQYTYTRARSVLQKAESENVKAENKIPENWEPTEVERLLYRFPEVVERACKEYSPHHLVTYLVEFAGAFNNFYAKEKIVDRNDPASPYKIALTFAVSQVLKNGLHLLGIKTLERM